MPPTLRFHLFGKETVRYEELRSSSVEITVHQDNSSTLPILGSFFDRLCASVDESSRTISTQ